MSFDLSDAIFASNRAAKSDANCPVAILEPVCVKLNGTAAGIALWLASVEQVFSVMDPWATLSSPERSHALSFRRPVDARRFGAARGLLRHALSETMSGQVATTAWRFGVGPYGKPFVHQGLPALEFSLSHCENWIAVAVSERFAVGVDLERTANCREIVEDVLTDGELVSLDNCDAEQRSSRFAKIWTLKEACAKALGRGASIDFRQLEVCSGATDSVSYVVEPNQKFVGGATSVLLDHDPYFLAIVSAPK